MRADRTVYSLWEKQEAIFSNPEDSEVWPETWRLMLSLPVSVTSEGRLKVRGKFPPEVRFGRNSFDRSASVDTTERRNQPKLLSASAEFPLRWSVTWDQLFWLTRSIKGEITSVALASPNGTAKPWTVFKQVTQTLLLSAIGRTNTPNACYWLNQCCYAGLVGILKQQRNVLKTAQSYTFERNRATSGLLIVVSACETEKVF